VERLFRACVNDTPAKNFTAISTTQDAFFTSYVLMGGVRASFRVKGKGARWYIEDRIAISKQIPRRDSGETSLAGRKYRVERSNSRVVHRLQHVNIIST
jgi:hypothetical protein